jgi:hypothetical protein
LASAIERFAAHAAPGLQRLAGTMAPAVP